MRAMIDCIYVAACAADARYTRICVASVRYFYPTIPIKLLIGGRLERGFAKELKRCWNVGLAEAQRGEYGWGFVKLEPLFGKRGERFLVLDSDTAIVGDVLALYANGADFLVDDAPKEVEKTEQYYDWQAVAQIGGAARAPTFFFNTGQWFGAAGVLTQKDFTAWLDWDQLPLPLKYPQYFKNGEQGVLNYVFNQKLAMGEISVDRRKFALWPGSGMAGITVETVMRRIAPPVILHWAGIRTATLGAAPGADVLYFFERCYYANIPFGFFRSRIRACRYFCSASLRPISIKARRSIRKLRGFIDRRVALSNAY